MNERQDGRVEFSAQELRDLRLALLTKRREVARSQEGQLSALHSGEGHHLADLEEMGDSSNTDSYCEIVDIETNTIEQIDRAIAKIDEGSYGSCENCSGQIHRARLKFLPFANLCIGCQREEERQRDNENGSFRFEELQ